MNQKNLEKLIEKRETQELEFTSKADEDIGKTICSFANTNEGVILTGVSDRGEVSGAKEKDEQKIANIAHTCKPSIYPEIEKVKVEGKVVFLVRVKKSTQLHSFKNIAYKRVGTHDKPLSPEEVIEFAKSVGKIQFDSQICEEASLENIDIDRKVKWYLEKREKVRKIPKQLDITNLLVNIGAAKKVGREVKPTNAGILLFGKVPQRFIIPTRITGARFKGTELSRTTTDTIDCHGTLWEMLEQAEDFVRKNIRLFGFRTEFSFRRIDKLEYPLNAIREAIINALIHRDYFEPSDIRLFIFDNKIEVMNPGAFPEGVSPEKPIHKPRNPVLCQLMRDVGFIEKYGSGIYFMRNLCREWGIPEPEYEITEMETKVTFKSSGEAVVVSEIEKLDIELNNRQKKALERSFSKGFLTRLDYMQLNKISHKTAHKELTDLVKKGLLIRRGKGRAVKYLIKIR